jgi:hypothetical protein
LVRVSRSQAAWVREGMSVISRIRKILKISIQFCFFISSIFHPKKEGGGFRGVVKGRLRKSLT